MLKAIMPLAFGVCLGALVVTVLLRGEDADVDPVAAVVASSPRSSPEPDIPAQLLIGASEAAARREAALGLLDARGYSSASADEIAATLPPAESVNFRIDAIVALSQHDARGALTAAMQLPDPEQVRFALERLAQSFAERDPYSALSELDAIDSAARENGFMAALLENWAIFDPAGALAFLADPGDVRIPATEHAFDLLANYDAERLLRVADGLVPDIRADAVYAAFATFAKRDPLAALARIGQLAPGPVNSNLEGEVAQAYGEQAPDEAWRWANESNASANTRMRVLAGIQSVDPGRALELMMAELTSVDADRSAQMRQRVGTYLYYLRDSAASDDIVIALDRILTQDSSLQSNVQQFIGAWADEEPEVALEWSLRNLDRIDRDWVLSSIGRSLARTNPGRVRQALYRLPEDDRASWVTGVGRTLAESDLAAAMEWAFEFPRGQLRDAALHEYVSSEAHGGSLDVQVFEQFSTEAARGQAASDVAYRLICDGHTALATEIASTQIADQDLLELTRRRIENDAAGLSSFGCEIRP